ncbi:Site-specific recombinase XerD [Devosia enhydra]|uniref:Site-specific recombinase XerD n=1 Tax=Devosia enhydra TaxID=665118 RepID=A0A1K2HUB7_9HYPH|nr:site-specific integrase [Devosia enhydra]SFZ81620.1 Site-specific recombinase XerD [Devosia enhydra]
MSLVYKREGSDYWYFNLNTDAGRRRLSTGVKDKREAERIAAEKIRLTRDAEMFGILPEVTIEEALLIHYLPLKKKLRGYPAIKRGCELLAGKVPGVKGLGGKTKFHRLNELDLAKYRAEREAMGARPNTIDREMAYLSNAYHTLRTAYRMPVAMKFPMERDKGKPRPLTEHEEQALLLRLNPLQPLVQKGARYFVDPLAHAQRQRVDNFDLAVLLLDTGARLGEIASLQWAQIDTVTFATFHLNRHKVGNFNIIALPTRSRIMLRQRWEERDASSPFVFPNSDLAVNRGAKSRSTKGLRKAMADIGINSPDNIAIWGRRDVRSLRDTFATKLRKRGLGLDRLQPLLGHASPVMTAKYAALAVHEASVEAVAILNTITTTYREPIKHDKTLSDR